MEKKKLGNINKLYTKERILRKYALNFLLKVSTKMKLYFKYKVIILFIIIHLLYIITVKSIKIYSYDR